MADEKFTERVKRLGVPLDQCIVIGSGVMGALGLRESADIDLVVTQELFDVLEREGWRKEVQYGEEVLLQDDVEVCLSWGTDKELVKFHELVDQSIIIDGVCFCSPEYLLRWKSYKARPKDIEDVKLLERYLKIHG